MTIGKGGNGGKKVRQGGRAGSRRGAIAYGFPGSTILCNAGIERCGSRLLGARRGAGGIEKRADVEGELAYMLSVNNTPRR